jgi:uncharacterized protein (TIGR03067 family)
MMSLKVGSPQNQRMKLTGAAILVSRGMKFLQAAPAAYPYRSAAENTFFFMEGSMKTRMLMVVAVGLLVAVNSGQGGDKGDRKSIQGTWILEAIEVDGKRNDATEKDKVEFKFVFTADKVIDGSGDKKSEGTFKLDPTKKPKTIELTVTKSKSKEKERTIKGVYELEGNKFRLCMNPGGELPTEVKSINGTAQQVWEFKRVKP